MKILIVLRKWNDNEGVGNDVKKIKEKFELKGHKVDIISREDDLNITSLSGSMGSLKETIRRKDEVENYDIIYTQDWSIAFPLLIPIRIFKEKHYCLFHKIQGEGDNGENSGIFQRIVGNMLGEKLLVKTESLKKMFPKAIFSPDGINIRT